MLILIHYSLLLESPVDVLYIVAICSSRKILVYSRKRRKTNFDVQDKRVSGEQMDETAADSQHDTTYT